MEPMTDTDNRVQDGWIWAENRMMEKDKTVMQDYSDDIDSLLVLDGLFSAVVTGFIVISVAMLQSDTGQTSVDLLSKISDQLATMTYLNSTVHAATAAAAAVATSFVPSAAARWINILWFLSLTFSLASAVFGILAKQWIREYLQWSSPTAESRLNVLVRQIRFEAWKEWHTAIIIFSIPALLELAVILFVSGMTIFLWTLDLVVAVVVTMFVAMFLLLVAFFTFLPTLFKRCPYRSPTAWVFVLLWRKVCTQWSQPVPQVQANNHPYDAHFEKIHVLSNADENDTWRGQDLQGAELTKLRDPWGRVADAKSLLLQELELEMVTIETQPSAAQAPPLNAQVSSSNAQAPSSNAQAPYSNAQTPSSSAQAPSSAAQFLPSTTQASSPTLGASSAAEPVLSFAEQAPSSTTQAPSSTTQASFPASQASSSSEQALFPAAQASSSVQILSSATQTFSPTLQALFSTVQALSSAVQALSSTVQALSSTTESPYPAAQSPSFTAQSLSSTAQASSSTAQALSSTAQASSSTAQALSSTARASSSTAQTPFYAAQDLSFATHTSPSTAQVVRRKTIQTEVLVPSVVGTYLLALDQSDVLFRALVKLIAELPDVGALRHLLWCAQSIQPSLNCAHFYSTLDESTQLAELAVGGGFRNMSVWYMLSRVNSVGEGHMGSFLTHPYVTDLPAGALGVGTHIINTVRQQLLNYGRSESPSSESLHTWVPPDRRESDAFVESKDTPISRSQPIVMSYVLASSLRACVAEALHPVVLKQERIHPALQLIHRRMEELLVVLRRVAFESLDPGMPQSRICRWDCAQILADVFNMLTKSSQKCVFDSLFPSLRHSIFLALCGTKHTVAIQFSQHNRLCVKERSLAEELSSVGNQELDLAIQLTLDVRDISHEDYAIFAQLVSTAMAGVSQMPADDVEKLFRKAADALRLASKKGWASTVAHLHDKWIGRLVERPVKDCRYILESAAGPFLRLLLALKAKEHEHLSSNNGVLKVLANLHLPAPTTWTDELASIKNQALRTSTTFLLHFAPGCAAQVQQQWFGLFVWAANQWLLEIASGKVSPEPPLVDAIPAVLDKMKEVLTVAIKEKYTNCGYDGGVFPWLKSILPVSDNMTSTGRYQDTVTRIAVIDTFHNIAPAREKFGALVDTLERAVDEDLFRSGAVNSDIRRLRVILLRGPVCAVNST